MSTVPFSHETPADLGAWVAENQGLLRTWVGRFDRRFDLDLAYGNCLIAVWKAAQRHDPTRGAKFSTYVCFWLESVRSNAYLSVKTKRRRFEQSHTPFSALESGDEWLPPTYTTGPDRFTSWLLEALARFLPTLSDREQAILSLRFGLTDGIDRTFDEVAELLGVTRQRVHQIERRALKKLRQSFIDAGDLKQPS